MKATYLVKIILIIVLTSFSYLVKAQCELTTEGKEFWVGFLENYAAGGEKTLELRITSKTATTCRVYRQGGTTLFATINIAANTSQRVILNPYTSYSFADQQILRQDIYIKSDDPVSVYALHANGSSSDATVLYPVNTLGREYYTLTHEASGNIGASQVGLNNNAQLRVVATEDNTIVEITPKTETKQGNLPNIPLILTLNRGESYLVIAKYSVLGEDGDLTGSKVVSTKPVAVFSGNIRATVSLDIRTSNHHFEQLPSVEKWGNSFITIPSVINTSPPVLRSHDRFKMVAQRNGTVITISQDPNSPITLNEGEFYQFSTLGNNVPRIIESSEPILVGQLATSDYYSSTVRGDSYFTLLSPNEQAIENVNFEAMSTTRIDEYHVDVVTKTSNTTTIRLDGNPLSFTAIMGTAYSYARSVLASGTHNLNNSNPANEGFIAYVYGYGNSEAYGYSVGSGLANIVGLGEDGLYCEGLVTERLLRGGSNFNTYEWRRLPNPTVIASTQEYTATQTGRYELTAIDAISCVAKDTIELTFSPPPIAQIKHNTVALDTFRLCDSLGMQTLSALDATHTNFTAYNWYEIGNPTPLSTEATLQVANFSATTTYIVKIDNPSSACNAFNRGNSYDTITVIFEPTHDIVIQYAAQIASDTLFFCDEDLEQEILLSNLPLDAQIKWYQNGILLSSITNTITLNNFSATTRYKVEVTRLLQTLSCPQTDEVVVVFTPTPISKIKIENQDVSTQNLVYCNGEGAKLLNGQEPSHHNQIRYEWYQTSTILDPLVTSFATTSSVLTTHFSSTKVYTLVVTDASNPAACGDTTFVTIQFKPSPNPTIYHDNQIADTVLRFCDNDNRQLLYVDSAANPNATTYQWFEQETNVLLSTFGSLWVDNFSDTTVYRVEADLDGCIEKDTVKVIFFPAAVILQGNQLAPDSLIFCDTDGSQNLEAGYTSTTGQVTYSWKDITNPSAIQVVGTDRILQVANFSDTTRYEITLVDAVNGILNACKVKDTVTVIFFGNSAVQIKKVGENHFPDSLILCASQGGINLTTGLPAHLLPTTSFIWSELAAPNIVIGTNPILPINEFVNNQTITKKYKVTINNSIFNCQVSDTITVVFLPPLQVSLTGNATICERQVSPVIFTLSGAFPLKLTYRETSIGGVAQIREVYVGTRSTQSPFNYTIQSAGGTYQVLFLRDTLCSLTPVPNTVVEIAVTPTPTVILSSLDTVICSNETTTFKATGATSYVFYKNGLAMTSSSSVNEYTPPVGTFQNGDRIWVIGQTNGCPDTSRIMRVIVNQLPVVNLGVDKYKCKTDTAFLTAPTGNFIYDWKKVSPTRTVISVGNGTRILAVVDTGTYFIRLENTLTGCSNTSNRVKVFNYDDQVVVNLGADKTVCSPLGLPYRLVASDLSHLAGTTYKWYVTGTNTVIGTDSVLDVRAENTYSVIVQDPRGCKISDTIRINLAPNPTFVITGHENPTCSRFDTLRIERTNVRNMTINWFGNGIVSLSDSNKVAIVNVSGIYTATVTDNSTSAKCSYTQSVEVFVRPTIDLGLTSTTASDTVRLCEGDSLVLNAFRPEHNSNFRYQWRLIEGNRVVSTNSKIAIKYEMVNNYISNRFEVKVTAPNLVGGGNCTILDTINVRFDRKSGVQIEYNFVKTLCLGQKQTLKAVGADSYQWSSGQTTQNIEIIPTEAGFYTYIVKGIFRTPNLCGASSDTIKFRVVPVPKIEIPEKLVICENDSVEIDAFLPSHEPGYVYEWKNENTGEIVDTLAIHVFKQDSANINYEPQTYRVGVYDTLGGGRCGAESLITVTFNRTSITEITASDTLVCIGEPITLRATGATNFRWNTGETTQEIIISSDSAGIFRYTVYGSYGDATTQNICDSTGTSILVQFKDIPKITLNKLDTISICTGDSVQFIAKGGFTYTWSHSPAASGDTVVVFPTDTTTYVVTGFDTLGCSNTDTTIVLVQPQINLGENQQFCEGDTAIIGSPRPFGATYLWNTGQTSDTIRVRRSGLYYVEVSINECSYTDSIQINFIEPPILFAKDTILCFEDENSDRIFHQIGVTIQNYDSTARYRYQWFDKDENLVGQDSLLSVEFGGVYLVRVTVEYANACTSITSLQVEASCEPQLFIPSAFTPNQDNLNEEWEIFGRFYSNLRIKVLDRWGMEVYSALQKRSDEQIKFWDGTYKGKKVPSGIYYYEVTYTSPTDKSKIIKQTGTVTIIY